MVRNMLLAGSLALLALGGSRPADAARGIPLPPPPGPSGPRPLHGGPYGSIIEARTFICASIDQRPKDAVHAQASRVENPTHRLILSPFVRDDDDTFWVGGSVGYGNVANPYHPWSVAFSAFSLGFDGLKDSEFGYDFSGKYVLWQPEDYRLPVVAVAAGFTDFGAFGDRWDLVLAVDQRVARDIFVTGNLGYASANYAVGDHSAFVPGIGVTWAARRNLSLSADFVGSNAVDFEDFWTVSALWAMNQDSTLRLGTGKHHTLFASYIRKWDWK